jgi:hypothetical protein
MTTNAPMKRFITVGLRRYKSADNAFTTRWDWDMMRKVPGIDPRNTPQAAERLVDIGLVPELTFYVDLLQPGNGDGEERERLVAAARIRGIADALGLIIVPLGRNVYEAFCAVDPRIRGQRIGQTDCGVLTSWKNAVSSSLLNPLKSVPRWIRRRLPPEMLLSKHY